MNKLFAAYALIPKLQAGDSSDENVEAIFTACREAMDDDFNTPIVLAHLFDAARLVNSVNDKQLRLTQKDIDLLKQIFDTFLFDILGMKYENTSLASGMEDKLMDVIIALRTQAKANKDYATADAIRDMLNNIGINLKDTKEGVKWEVK